MRERVPGQGGPGPAVGSTDPEEFEKELERGASREKRMDWDDAEAFYDALLAGLGKVSGDDRHGRAMRAMALLRKGNALMELGRWEDARRTFDEALHEAKASGDEGVLGQAALAAGTFAGNRGDSERAEAFLLESLELFHRRNDRASLQGRGWAFLNLASLYGRTGRLDLAFVTFTKAQNTLGAAENWGGVAAAWEAQGQLRRVIGDEERWQDDLSEAVIFYDREGMKEKADALRTLLGRRIV